MASGLFERMKPAPPPAGADLIVPWQLICSWMALGRRPILPLGTAFIFFYGRKKADMGGCRRRLGGLRRGARGTGRGARGKKRHAPGRCGNWQARTPALRGRGSGFGLANCSAYALIPWGKGATQRGETGEKDCKQSGMGEVAPDIEGARWVAHECHEWHE